MEFYREKPENHAVFDKRQVEWGEVWIFKKYKERACFFLMDVV